MEDKLPWVVGAIAIIVIAIALSNYLGLTSKQTGTEVISAWGESAKSNLSFSPP